MTQPPGLRRHLDRLRRLAGPELIRVAGAAVYEAADDIRAEAFRSISAGSVSGAGHVASRPGEPPNRDTGTLQAGLKVAQTGPLTAEVRSEAPYAAALEFGTSKMAARPYMRPARDKNLDRAQRRLSEQINRLIRRS
jgi:HK97 gp10 family phage protein